MSRSLRRRVIAYLDAAHGRGAFNVSGMFVGLDAADIADEIARDWDSNDRDGKMLWQPGHNKPESADIERYVSEWLLSME